MPVENQGHTELSIQMLKQLPSQCNNFFEFKDLCLHVRPLHDVSLHQWQCMSTYIQAGCGQHGCCCERTPVSGTTQNGQVLPTDVKPTQVTFPSTVYGSATFSELFTSNS